MLLSCPGIKFVLITLAVLIFETLIWVRSQSVRKTSYFIKRSLELSNSFLMQHTLIPQYICRFIRCIMNCYDFEKVMHLNLSEQH